MVGDGVAVCGGAADERGQSGAAGPASFVLERYLKSLHLEDLALACACADGDEAAWEHFVREYRPSLYRAADALDPSGRARELADSLYADLYGTTERAGERRSLFRYFHGRSSLPTWLRAVLAQRHVDAIRARPPPRSAAGRRRAARGGQHRAAAGRSGPDAVPRAAAAGAEARRLRCSRRATGCGWRATTPSS